MKIGDYDEHKRRLRHAMREVIAELRTRITELNPQSETLKLLDELEGETMKLATLRVVWQDSDSEPECEIMIKGETTDDERRRLLLSLAWALIARYGPKKPTS